MVTSISSVVLAVIFIGNPPGSNRDSRTGRRCLSGLFRHARLSGRLSSFRRRLSGKFALPADALLHFTLTVLINLLLPTLPAAGGGCTFAGQTSTLALACRKTG